MSDGVIDVSFVDVSGSPASSALTVSNASTEVTTAAGALVPAANSQSQLAAQVQADVESFTQIFANIHNQRVIKYFSPVNTDKSDIANQKAFLLGYLTINIEEDSIGEMMRKQYFFNAVVGAEFEGITKTYGVPIDTFQASVAYEPQVALIFKERTINGADLPLRKYKLWNEISFRLTANNIPRTSADLRNLASKIKLQFFSGIPYSYWTGLHRVNYYDPLKGYRFNREFQSKAIGQETYRRILAINGDTLDSSLISESILSPPTIQYIQTVSGIVQKPIPNRIGNLYFSRAEYKQKGIPDKILVDAFGSPIHS